jgi:hypothetical protein
MRIDDLTTFGSILTKHLALAVGPMAGAVIIWFVVNWILAGFHSKRAEAGNHDISRRRRPSQP